MESIYFHPKGVTMRKELNVSKKLKRPRKHSLERYFNPNLISVIYRRTHTYIYRCPNVTALCAPVNRVRL